MVTARICVVWDLAVNFASTHQTKNPRGFSEVGENKQLLIAIVGLLFFIFLYPVYSDFVLCQIT